MSKTTTATTTSKSVAEVQADEQKLEAIVNKCTQIGVVIGNHVKQEQKKRGQLIEDVTALLKTAMSEGLTVDMLKASSKKETRPCYDVIVKALKAKCDIKDEVRDKYMSKIRNFVRDRGANPLDLFGNLAVEKAKQDAALKAKEASNAPANVSTQPTTTQSNPQPESKEESKQEEVAGKIVSFEAKDAVKVEPVNMKGLPALNDYLVAWLDKNPVMTQRVLELTKQFQAEIAKLIPAK